MNAATLYQTFTVRIPQGVDPRPLQAFAAAMGWQSSCNDFDDETDDEVFATMPGQFTDEEKVQRVLSAINSDECIPHDMMCNIAQAI